MKKLQNFSVLALLLSIALSLGGCAVVGGIFKAGVGVGVFMVVAVIALIIFIITRIGRR
jgi:hypothetical protein